MYGDLRFLGLIPARGGSKGIPQKNIVQVAGKPLIHYTIDAALESTYLDDVVISTDSEEIASVARRCGASVPFMRPDDLGSDQSKTIDVVMHAIDELKQQGVLYDAVVLLQPTQPLRTASQINEAIELFIKSRYESVIGVCPVIEHPILMRTINTTNRLQSLLGENSTVRRQDFLPVFKVNGAIYINRIDENLSVATSLNDNIIPYQMRREDSLDIDVYDDLTQAEKILSNRANGTVERVSEES